jgi:hypothetical protein
MLKAMTESMVMITGMMEFGAFENKPQTAPSFSVYLRLKNPFITCISLKTFLLLKNCLIIYFDSWSRKMIELNIMM